MASFPAVRDLYDEAGLDFYDWHAYEFSDDKFIKLPESFGPKKPFTLTEWGWEDAGDGDLFYEQDFDGLLAQVEAGKIAGHAFWSWNDVHQFDRVDWGHSQRYLAFRSSYRKPGDPGADLFQAGRSVCRQAGKLRCTGPRAAHSTSSPLGSLFSGEYISGSGPAVLGGLSGGAKILASL